MKLIKGDIWKFHDRGEWICVTTNGFVKVNGQGVMGKGTADQCRQRYPDAPWKLGQAIRKYGNVPTCFMKPLKILSFPVKHNWWESADMKLIEESAEILRGASLLAGMERIYLPQPGCGSGGLRWPEVERVLRSILNDDAFIIVQYDPYNPIERTSNVQRKTEARDRE